MAKYTLTFIDIAGIQEYIFDSNNLAQNIGASERVTQVTWDWVFEVLRELSLKNNAQEQPANNDCKVNQWEITDQTVAGNGLSAEVIYAGGGNAAVLFKDDGQRKEFVKRLTFRALKEAPGLQLVVKSEQIEWGDKGNLKNALARLRLAVAGPSTGRAVSTPLLGLGVTANCDFTALPVYGAHVEPSGVTQMISRVVDGKLKATEDGKERLHCVLSEVRQRGYEFIYDFDQFGTLGESSYIAVIHVDGNGMGERFRKLEDDDDTSYAQKLRAFSRSIQRASQAALQKTVRTLLDNADKKFDGELEVTPHPRDGQRYLPFRPIVFGGDDVTFVADGRLGLTLAAAYLDVLLTQPETLEDKEPLYARAGIAVVKTHYPFSRAYELSEALSKSAKEALTDRDNPKEAVMDWHFSTSGAILPLAAIRQREYTARGGRKLIMRPIKVTPDLTDYWRNWQAFAEVTQEFRISETWGGRRNKVKALRDALRIGEMAVTQFLENYQLDSKLPPLNLLRLEPKLREIISGTKPEELTFLKNYLKGKDIVPAKSKQLARALWDATIQEDKQAINLLRREGVNLDEPPWSEQLRLANYGWESKGDNRCGYFDAIEATDFFIQLARSAA